MARRQRINGELCERVDDASDLTAPALVYVRCDWHPGKWHRGMLLGMVAIEFGIYASGDVGDARGWDLVPKPTEHPMPLVVAIQSVDKGYVWRVVDDSRGLLSRFLDRFRRRAQRPTRVISRPEVNPDADQPARRREREPAEP